jgi:hypothetical protein
MRYKSKAIDPRKIPTKLPHKIAWRQKMNGYATQVVDYLHAIPSKDNRIQKLFGVVMKNHRALSGVHRRALIVELRFLIERLTLHLDRLEHSNPDQDEAA